MDLASSLTQEEIPIKLRCAICNKLVVNAFGLPCCDQSICGNCQSSLPDSCPVCSHSPLSADDCKPKKNLRLTVKAYLKSEEKKRDKERAVGIAGKPETPVTPGGTAPAVVQSIEQPIDAPQQATANLVVHTQEQRGGTETAQPSEAPQTDAAPPAADQPQAEDANEAENPQEQDPNSKDPAADPTTGDDADVERKEDDQEGQEGAQDGQEAQGEGDKQNGTWNAGANGTQASGQAFGNGFGFDNSQAGFNGMNWGASGGFNPMMMNGMSNGNWNSFGMMGMPGMGMDPMAMSQGMFGGYGGQGMGMNGMNMGMGYGGGTRIASMGPAHISSRSRWVKASKGALVLVLAKLREVPLLKVRCQARIRANMRIRTLQKKGQRQEAMPLSRRPKFKLLRPMGGFGNADPNAMGMNMGMGMGMGMDPSFIGMAMPGRGRGGFRGGYGRGYQNFRGGFGGRGMQGSGFEPSGGFGGNVTVLAGGEPKGVGVEGAPTGPKAMREGLPNTGASGRLRGAFAGGIGKGFSQAGSAPSSEHQQRSRTPAADERDDAGSVANGTDVGSEAGGRRKRDKYRDREKERDRDYERKEKERDRDRERERDRDKDKKRSSRRDRSGSPSYDYSDDDRHHRSSRRRREKEREKERDRAERAARKEDDQTEGETEFKIQGRSKNKAGDVATGPAGSSSMPPPSHPKGTSGSRLSPPFQAPKGPSSSRTRDREREKDKDRESSSRRNSAQSSAPGTPSQSVDPHTLEREARNRERMLKEAQRRASLQNPSSSSSSSEKRKRGHEGFEDEKPFAPPTGPSAERERHGSSKRRRGSEAEASGSGSREERGRDSRKRRVSYKYEDEENDEARARRVESEREAQRWR
ncbi:hypothetical protein GTA08_BOTSDO00643 [Neofusicoccum parvum]|uniref:Uncharacterized protein n=1 Tax=Neofusicoccum parvum TaxID=310453 RepID=A0ACB5SCG3_9PEZI|nr:hypothetical protein GTA08_BOTSDO00643 [Neofusicoccum parvum]